MAPASPEACPELLYAPSSLPAQSAPEQSSVLTKIMLCATIAQIGQGSQLYYLLSKSLLHITPTPCR